MGGKGSGGHNRLSDEEKKRRGTFEKRHSEEVHAQKMEAKVVTGPWLSAIPKSDIALGDFGEKKYKELTQMLFDRGVLTSATCMTCQQIAMLMQSQVNMLARGKDPPVSMISKITNLLAQLKVAENATPIGQQTRKNKFEGAGFSNSRNTPFRLRAYTASDS